jgi:hypothetical protein
MAKKRFAMGSVRRLAKQIVNLSRQKRAEIIQSLPTDMKFRVIEELSNLKKGEKNV